MRGKIRLSRWLLAATLLMVAECTGAAWLELPYLPLTRSLPATFSDPTGRVRNLTNFWQNLFASPNWRRQQRTTHRPTDSSRTPQQHRTKLKPDQNKPTKSSKHTAGPPLSKTCRCRDRARPLGLNRTPLPKRPVPTSIVPMSPAHQVIATSELPRSPLSSCCQGSSARVNAGGHDMVRLDAVMLPDHRPVEVRPTAVLRCAMADPLLLGFAMRPQLKSPLWALHHAVSRPMVRTNAAAVTMCWTPNLANMARATLSMSVP